MHIKDVLHGKGETVVTITPVASIRELVRRLAEHNVGALVVSTDGRAVHGIVSERDVVRLLDRESDAMDRTVDTIMTTQVQTCEPSAHVDEIMALMTEHHIRHVPVVVDGELAGIVSIGDVVKTRIGELEFEREQLSHYITSAP
jgi:CBS domain-containing protein